MGRMRVWVDGPPEGEELVDARVAIKRESVARLRLSDKRLAEGAAAVVGVREGGCRHGRAPKGAVSKRAGMYGS